MTEQEAIERLKCLRLYMQITDKQSKNKFLEDDYIANKMAISALEEIQKYRELDKERGNILKRLLNGEWVDTKDVAIYLNIDFSEGLKLFEFNRTAEWNPPPLNGQKITTEFRLRNEELEELQQYRALGTVEELREAREKHAPKKAVFVHPIQLNDGGDYMCPACKTGTILNAYGGKSKYCPWCGQAIDWRDT